MPHEDIRLEMDIQTTANTSTTTEDGTKAIQTIKGFSDDEILTTDEHKQQKADKVYFQGKWFACTSCTLSENTPLRHYVSLFTECLDQEVEDELDAE